MTKDPPLFFFFGSACTYSSCCALPCGSVILLEAGIPPYLMLYVYYYLLFNAPAIFEISCRVWGKKKLGFVLNMLLPAAFSIIKIGIVSHAHAVLRAAFN